MKYKNYTNSDEYENNHNFFSLGVIHNNPQ